ncbi:hypothetical protein QBC46DRAFT_306734 [Diplogelasinospora grovesii]|uniref:Tyrosinase copper-binding domain-containing protein n=1 Tax=Diplogelasinospora grovesii TaxID=303347 RepID=A0AAN6ND86_9PEZI|nr:hypothetical protein QBC46DRAFT_306734 [Diplogelasinospora grovesii]
MSPLKLALIALGSLAHVVVGQYSSYNYGFDIARRVKRDLRDVPQPLIVRGAGQAEGRIALRREIRDLQQDEDQWTLYILGLSLLQYMDQTTPTSWYGITGIHGIPHTTWAGVTPVPGSENTGYCAHISSLFPTWHRPYLALYEQVLYDMVQTIAGMWTDPNDKARYQAAAVDFRIPFWDWATSPPAGESVLPPSVGGSPWVDINGPFGAQRIANPLFSFPFIPFNATAMLSPPFDRWDRTYRHPTTNYSDAISDNSYVAMTLDSALPSFQQRLYNLYSNYPNYTAFSTYAFDPTSNIGTFDSLEGLHDSVHDLAGGGGHMSYIPYSAFDPIFFLHHAMVDRIFAIWQALYSETWVQPEPAKSASYTTLIGQIQDSTTPLTPFFADSDGTFWTSDTVRDHTILGYTYAELVGNGPNASQATKAQVRRHINRLYGSSSPASFAIKASSKTKRASSDSLIKLGKRWNEKKPRWSRPMPSESPIERVLVGGRYREWTANIHVDKQALNGPFKILFFLGPPPQDHQTWTGAPNLVGTMGVFAAPEMDGGMQMGRQDITATVPLTAALVKRVATGELESLDPRDVEPYLKRYLEHRIITSAGGTVIEPSEIRSLGIHIVSASVRAPSSDQELPRWGKTVAHFDL